MKHISPQSVRHVVLITLDTLRADAISSGSKSDFIHQHWKGHGAFKTVGLDHVIRSGTYFDSCISAAPYTTASHAAYFTGCWPRRNGVYEYFNRRMVMPTIFELAKRSGYQTIFQTDFPIILGEHLGFRRGVDHYFIEDENAALARVISASKKQPTLSFFHFGGIHYPYGFHKWKFGKQAYPQKVNDLERTLRLKLAGRAEDILDESFRDRRDKNLLFRYKRIVEELYKRKQYDTLHALYLEGVDYFMRHRFEFFLEELLAFVDAQDALLVIFADHGEEWSEESRGHANSVAHGVLHVPFMMYGAGIAKQTRVPELIRTIDMAPSVCERASIVHGFMDGQSIHLDRGHLAGPSRIAHAQVWRVGDKLKVHTHQQKILRENRMIAPLLTRLEKEVVYRGGMIAQRDYGREGSYTDERFFCWHGQDIEPARVSPATRKRFVKVFEDYHRIKREKGEPIQSVSRDIAEGFRLMGYRI